MTTNPQDLLNFRADTMAVTGLTNPADVGIKGDDEHAERGGYHMGLSEVHAGSDYSTSLQRDRSGLTSSASATDVAHGWPHGGDAAWIRWNNELAAQLKKNNPNLAAIRAINYTPDGHTKWRIDREHGWATGDTSDTVDVHTHIEFYRDTEGKRVTTLNTLVAMMKTAIDPTQEDDVKFHWQLIIPPGDPTLVEWNEDGTLKAANQTGYVIASPWDLTVASVGCDFGSACVRIAEMEAQIGWLVRPLITVHSTDKRRTDLHSLQADRRSISRVPIDKDDKLDAALVVYVYQP